MLTFLLNTLLSLLSRLDPIQLGEAAFAAIIKKVPDELQEQIKAAIKQVDGLDLSGEEKFRLVITELRDPKSPLRFMVRALSQKALLIAVQGIYESMKAK